MKNITVLDCTLRDGSYLIDYQFTAEDTFIICKGLERAGFLLIEIGHGTGLGSTRAGKGIAAAPDEKYLHAASAALAGTSADFGMFFIPGLGKIEDLDLAAEYGMGFVRIGTNVTEVENAEPFINHAKKLGMLVSANLMKTYSVSIREFLKYAKQADAYGADIISVVDSAGGMFPGDVKKYVSSLYEKTKKQIGFHGHNNLHLAMANSLEAVNCGAVVIDATLQGMGRSAGNTQAEILIPSLEKLKYKTGIDIYKVFDFGEKVIKPMMYKEQGVDDISIISGIAQFHSGFSPIINEMAKEYHIDPRKLIVEVSHVDRINVTRALAEKVAIKIQKDLKKSTDKNVLVTNSDFYEEMEEKDCFEKAKNVLNHIKSLSKKSGKLSVMTLTLSKKRETAFPYIRQSASMVIGNCEAANLSHFKKIVEIFKGKVDWILFDSSCEELKRARNKTTNTTAWYSEKRALFLSIAAILAQEYKDGKILVFSNHDEVAWINTYLAQYGIGEVVVQGNKESGRRLSSILPGVRILVSFGKECSKWLRKNHLKLLRPETKFYAIQPNSFEDDFWAAGIKDGRQMYRLDGRIGLEAEIQLVVETQKLLKDTGGVVIEGVEAVSGGKIGKEGSVILDSIINPKKVIGITDGLGGVLKDDHKYRNRIKQVQSYIFEQVFNKEF